MCGGKHLQTFVFAISHPEIKAHLFLQKGTESQLYRFVLGRTTTGMTENELYEGSMSRNFYFLRENELYGGIASQNFTTSVWAHAG